jgi:hypothetical protein
VQAVFAVDHGARRKEGSREGAKARRTQIERAARIKRISFFFAPSRETDFLMAPS